MLREIHIERFWNEATDKERRVFLNELLDAVFFFPDHLEVSVAAAPRLNIALSEVGMKGVSTVGVGGGTRYKTPRTPYSPDQDFCLAERLWAISRRAA